MPADVRARFDARDAPGRWWSSFLRLWERVGCAVVRALVPVWTDALEAGDRVVRPGGIWYHLTPTIVLASVLDYHHRHRTNAASHGTQPYVNIKSWPGYGTNRVTCRFCRSGPFEVHAACGVIVACGVRSLAAGFDHPKHHRPLPVSADLLSQGTSPIEYPRLLLEGALR